MVDMSGAIDLVLDAKAALGESPVWSVAEQALYFVDIKGQRIHRFDPASGAHEAFEVDEDIGCIGLAKEGGFVAAMRSGVWLLDGGGRKLRQLAENPEDQSVSRFNDGGVDPSGRFLAGTIDEPKTSSGAGLYRYDKNGLTKLKGGLLTSNGVAFSPDGATLYHADTPRFTIFAHDYDAATGAISEGRIFAQLPMSATERGRPDGAAVDVEGCYWTALFEGGRVQRYAADGELLGEYRTPAYCPTMVAFGGADMKTLFITSARIDRSAEELAAYPLSGALFAMRVETPGVPRALFDPNV